MRVAFLRLLALTLSALFTSACATDGARSAGSEDALLAAELEPILDAAAAEGFAGQIVIVQNGVVAYRRAAGFADLNGATPVFDDTLFHVASLTKYFTAALVMKAVEDGLLALDAPASMLFPDSPLGQRDFVLSDLLSHRSGLRSTYAAEARTDASAAVVAIAEANRDNAKDGLFHYSNDNYDLLAILLERKYGAPFEALFREKLANPAGLRNFGFWGEADLGNPRVRSQPLEPEPPELNVRNYGMLGSAGLLITADDLAIWQQALSAGAVISAQSYAELIAPRLSVSVGNAAYGSFLIETPVGSAISARGSEQWGDNAYLNHYPRCGAIVAITTSRGPAEGSGRPLFRDQLIASVEKALGRTCKHQN